MTRAVYRVRIDRVLVTGASASTVDPAALRAQLQSRLATDLQDAALPTHRSALTRVALAVPASTRGAVTDLVIAGVAHALRPGAGRG